jgi:hypothetical protein
MNFLRAEGTGSGKFLCRISRVSVRDASCLRYACVCGRALISEAGVGK